jgi:DNA mismatch repair protein MutL
VCEIVAGSIIKILPEILSNKIAAGEVVERPASVVKELVENAVDAHSSSIIIEVENGGRSLIRVSDNGIGMNPDDALLAMERYATSKIYNEKDLFSIQTLGFRGEAIPSIASVSRFYIETNVKGSSTGAKIFVEGGTIKKVSETGAPEGTMITVKHLFFNTPARRKFLKSDSTEFSHVADITARIALSRPDIRFKLYHNGTTVKDWPAVSDSAVRITDVLGISTHTDFYPVNHKHGSFSITGWISSSGAARATSRGIYVYVNGRFVKDRIVQHALFEGYNGRLMKGQFPLAVLFIQIPFDQVDVNVHPTKNEVRFADSTRVHNATVTSVKAALASAEKPTGTTYKTIEPEKTHVFDPVLNFKTNNGKGAFGAEKYMYHMSRPAEPQQEPLWHNNFFRGLRVIGQLHHTYILCESSQGLIMVDQHAAHERILYENIKKRKAPLNAVQKQIVCETIDLNYREKDILEKIIPELATLGLHIEPFGGDTFVVKSVPALLSGKDIRPIILEIVETMADVGFSAGLSKKIDQCLMLMACHGAIRANQHLSTEEINGLLNQLDECDNSSCCPHGRPTWIKWDLTFFDKSFKRIV